MRRIFPSHIAAALVIVGLAAVVAHTNWREGRRSQVATRAKVATAVRLADSLLRDARVSGKPSLAFRAEETLLKTREIDPDNYEVSRALAAVYLSQHRFSEAIAIAERNRQQRPHDPVNYGIIGDGHLELGHYDEAFDAFDRMMTLKPSAASYARVAYAREIQGDLSGALEAMKLAADATSARDREGLAWAHAQVGELHLQLSQWREAQTAFQVASASFPGHPLAVGGQAKVLAAEGDLEGALALLRELHDRHPTPDLAARIGDLLAGLGREDEAEQAYAIAEAAWRTDSPEPKDLARFLATHERRVEEAVEIAERAAAARQDIFSNDALAWAYFKKGRVAEAQEAIARALRTGTKDREILAHAAAIQQEAERTSVEQP
jgi:tetratricopeptide (TPR) repeat protein